MPLKKQERKQEYSRVIGLKLKRKNKEAFNKLACMCGKDTGLFIMADYDKEIAKLDGQWIDLSVEQPQEDFEVLVCIDDDVFLSIFRCGHVDGEYWFDCEHDKKGTVTHWQPKPEPITNK